MRKQKIGIAIFGLGTVGSGVINLINKQRASIKLRTGVDLQVKTVCAKSKRKKRPFNLSSFNWVDDPISLTKDKEIDVIVELVGGEKGISRRVIEEGIKRGKHIVTVNKSK